MNKIFPRNRNVLSRMHRILERIQKGDFPSRPILAGEIEVTQKTIQRDINFMRDFFKHPIEYDRRKFGYYLSRAVSSFPLVQLSQKELVAVFVAQKAIAQYAGTPFEQPLKTAFDKLIAGLDGEMAFAWSELQHSITIKNIEATTASMEIFQNLNLAIQERREIRFMYKKLDTTVFEERHVRPLQLGCINHHWYLFSFCLKRKAIRTFALTRMRTMRVLSATFTEPRNFSASQHLQNSFGVFAGKDVREVTIRFDRFATQLIRERNWHPSQRIKALANDEAEVSFTLSGLEEVESWILSWGAHARVVSPRPLVQRIRQTLKSTLRQY